MRLKCPHCGISGKAPSLPAGRLARCPRCTELFLLPEEEEPRQAASSAELFELDVAVLPSALAEDDGQEDRGNVYEPGEQESGEPVEEEPLADESWLSDEFPEDPVPADPEDRDNVMSGVSDGYLETEEIDGSEEPPFDETFGAEPAASFEYQDISDTVRSSDSDRAGSLAEEGPGKVKKSNYPDFAEHQVNWQEEQPEPVTFDELGAEQKSDDEDAASPQPGEEAIQQELDDMLASTCVACDNPVAEEELYCPDCLKKKAAGSNPSAAVADADAESGKKKKTLWLGIGLLAVVLVSLIGFLLLKWGLI